MPNRSMRCAIARHKLQGPGVRITNPKLIKFVKSVYPEFRQQEKVCPECKKFIKFIYDFKQRREMRKRRQVQLSTESGNTTSSSSDISLGQLIHTQVNPQNSPRRNRSGAKNDVDSNKEATTSRQAGRRQQQTAACESTSSEDLILLPHVQPRVRKRDFITLRPDIMQMYLKGIRGG